MAGEIWDDVEEKTMNILVTGGAGYIGSVLVPNLRAGGHTVTVLDSLLFGGQGLLGIWGNSKFSFVHCDVRDADATSAALEGMEAVVHLAALVGESQCKRNPEATEEVNFLATRRLVHQAKAQGVKKFVFASTCSNYGISERGVPADEDAELKPLSLYAETKVRAEAEVLNAAGDGFQPVVLRFATAYGLSPRMRFDLLLNEFVRDAVVDNYLLVYGANSWRPFVHVRDVARFVRDCIEGDLSGVFNVGGHNLRKEDLVSELLKLEPDLDVDFKEGKRDPRNYQVSFERAASIGFSPIYKPVDGILSIASALRSGVFQDPHSGVYRNA